jgi:hypothetical protein
VFDALAMDTDDVAEVMLRVSCRQVVVVGLGKIVVEHVQLQLTQYRQSCESPLEQCAQSREVVVEYQLGAVHDLESRQACRNAGCSEEGEQQRLVEHNIAFDLEVLEMFQTLNLNGSPGRSSVVIFLINKWRVVELLPDGRQSPLDVSFEAVGLELTEVGKYTASEEERPIVVSLMIMNVGPAGDDRSVYPWERDGCQRWVPELAACKAQCHLNPRAFARDCCQELGDKIEVRLRLACWHDDVHVEVDELAFRESGFRQQLPALALPGVLVSVICISRSCFR